jgi:hypothetical protein
MIELIMACIIVVLVSVSYHFYRKNKINCSAFISNKALKHLSRACLDHIKLCKCNDSVLLAMIKFSDATLNSNIIKSNNKMIENIENQLIKMTTKYNHLAKLVEEFLNDNSKMLKLKKACLCDSIAFCKVHGNQSQTKL